MAFLQILMHIYIIKLAHNNNRVHYPQMSHTPPKHILITGASSGIGAALAKSYADTEITLYLAGRNQVRLEKISTECEKLGAKTQIKVIDVTNQQGMRNWITSLSRLDLCIANAGIAIGDISPTDDGYEDVARKIFDVNLMGVMNTIHPAIDIMKIQSNGQIAIVSSLAGYRGLPTAPAYSASKTAVKAYGEALGPSLRSNNIHMSVICPGFVKSGITDRNRFPMPFLMNAEKAAIIIKGKLESYPPLISFPFTMRLISWIFKALPTSISLKILSISKEKKG